MAGYWGLRVGAWLEELKRKRPVFHSEADFQHALAWTAHLFEPSLRVRLEVKTAVGHLDLLISVPEQNRHLALELKYLKAAWSGAVGGERFELANQGAQDIRGYDVVKDISRVEQLTGHAPGWSGGVLVLSNEPSYWSRPDHGRATNADAFRVYEGSQLSGVRAWGPYTGSGTMKGRTDPIRLRGAYRCAWSGYSRLEGRRGDFRLLSIPVLDR
ncbi:hypothetical protein DFP74_4175 [Nocardiopsis sp. Huas11]|uniref:hypothetical protein n=1 Tax=Nocardiopsis sp. Huas11 TaxID=2183912 RepID=UPI000F29BAA2|nr:hypothetical protein [Nocardiopsis sp. Huas11]RKS08474.1 hypothetical protein DFP74_4175 [Nocardiopsis sp. Huas11]